jgi:hypothetical protein
MPRAQIATQQAMHTLLQLHAELGGKILDNKAEAKRLADSMRHVEAVLKMLKPGYDTRPIAIRRRKPNPWFKRGTVFRGAVDVLRAAGEPLSAPEIARRMVAAKGVKRAPRKGIRDLAGAILSSLRNHRGGAVTAHDQMRPTLWSLSSN